MTSWLFASDNESWGTADFSWTGAAGSPALGCMFANGAVTPFDYVTSARTGLSIAVAEADPLSFRCRFTKSGEIGSFTASLVTGLGTCFADFDETSFSSDDTGWVVVEGAITSAGTVEAAEIRLGNVDISDVLTGAYFDSVYIAEAPANPQLRILGLAADTTNLYVTTIENSLLTFETRTLASGGITDTDTFGSAAYTDPDSFTKGIYPVVKPNNDKVVYVRGRDASSKQVYYNDLNGTLGWVDVGPGTATWGTAKFAVALMPAPLRPLSISDVVVAFSDNDIYQTLVGTASWTKLADAPVNLRTAARHPTSDSEMLLAGTAAGTLYYTHNLADSFDAAGGTAMGTINHIEFTWWD